MEEGKERVEEEGEGEERRREEGERGKRWTR